MARFVKWLFALALVGAAGFTAHGQSNTPADEPIRLDLRLTGADLVDEMVYTWIRTAPFQGAISLVVAEVDAPIGLDHRFEETLENHLFEVLRANPNVPVSLVHCALCRQWVAISNPKRTVLGRVIEQPEALAELQKMPQTYALSLHFDVVSTDLVLWAEVYELKSPQRVIWSQRFSGATSARSVLQEPSKLVSLADARAEQRRLIAGKDSFQAVTRFPIRTFQGKTDSGTGVVAGAIPPVIFLEQSIEAILSPQRNRRLGLSIGLTSLQGTMQGWSFGAHYLQLLGRTTPSLSQPDLYLKLGVNYLRLEGPGAVVFSEGQIDVARLVNAKDDPRASLTAFQIGLETHVKYRFGLSVFAEYMPVLDKSEVIATQKLLLPVHSLGVAGVFLW